MGGEARRNFKTMPPAFVFGTARPACAQPTRLFYVSRTPAWPSLPPPPHLQIPAPSLWDDATRSLTVVVPAYNEEERLPRALDELLR